MGVRVAGNCWQSIVPHSTSPSSVRSSQEIFLRGDRRSRFLGSAAAGHATLWRSCSWKTRSRGDRRHRHRHMAICLSLESSAGGDEEEDFVKRLHDIVTDLERIQGFDSSRFEPGRLDAGGAEPPGAASPDDSWLGMAPEPPRWPEEEQILPASVERNANRVDLPLSLRIIKRKKRWAEELQEAGESARCSVKKAFSSMVFIVREIQIHALRMREALFFLDLQSVLARVHHEMHASFVWLFQQIFSCTPCLMVYVMILLANFTVFSMSQSPAFAAAGYPNPPPGAMGIGAEEHREQERLSAATVKPTFSAGRTAMVGGGGGGRKVRPVAGATDDGLPNSSHDTRTFFPDGVSTVPSPAEESGGGAAVISEDETAIWNSMVDEATKMQSVLRIEPLMDPDVLQHLVSPIATELEPEDLSCHLETELMYHHAVSKDPNNPLLLANFAQFLFLVLHDNDRAEYYFKRASRSIPADAEALSRYASFLWVARNDVAAAEEMFLEAIAADPNNTASAASYANFLWNTGGEDTCYPLDDPHAS